MSNRYSSVRKNETEYSLWLIFDRDGGARMTRGEPQLARDERAMSVSVTLPAALFNTPTLSASIKVEGEPQPIQIDARACADAIKQAIGVDVDLTVNQPEDPAH